MNKQFVEILEREINKEGMLTETTGFNRNKVYLLQNYVEAFKIYD